MKIKISDIKVGENRREIDESNVLNLVKSIREVGLINPITIAKDHKLIAGAHRIEAYRRMGLAEIECTIVEIDGLKAELAEIDENLIRHNLNHIDEGEQLLRKKEIYEILYPETKAGVAGGMASGAARRTTGTIPVVQRKSFVEDTADKMQITPSSIRKKIQIAKGLTPEVKNIVKENKIGEKNSLKLVRIKEPEKQKEAAEKLAAGEPIVELPVFQKPSPEEFKNIFKAGVTQLKKGPEDAMIPVNAFVQEYEAFAEETIRSIGSYGREQYMAIYPLLSGSQKQKITALNTSMLEAIRRIDELQKGN